MKTQVIRYSFQMSDNTCKEFKLELNPIDLELRGNIPEHLTGVGEAGFSSMLELSP